MKEKEEFLSLDWFKKRVEKAIYKVVEDRVDSFIAPVVPARRDRPYLTLKLVNEVLTVVLKDGRIFTKPNAVEKDYLLLQTAESEKEILAIIEDDVVAEQVKEDKKEAVKLTNLVEGFNSLGNIKDFKTEGTSIYLKGTSRTIPPLLVNKFAEIVGRISKATPSEFIEDVLKEDDEYQGLKNFFMWCCLNPRAEVAASLYDFLSKNGMKITKQGFFVALRNVVVVTGNKEDSKLIDVISNGYNKVKAVWKKNPADFTIVKDAGDRYSVVK